MAKQTNRPTIRDVAADCGLSIATVSAVVNDAGWVPDHTRDRVRRSIIALGYRPNRLARSLKTSFSDTVGVIVSDVTNPYFTDIVRSLGHVLREHDRILLLSESEHEFALGERNLRILLEKQVDAIAIVGDSVDADVLTKLVADRDLPIVSIGRSYDMDGVSELLVDTEQGAFEATLHLIERGYRNPAMISGPSSGSGSQSYGHPLRITGFRRALREAGLAEDTGRIVEGNFRIDGGRHAMIRLLETHPAPDAVFAANDLMAFGVLEVLRERGISVPDQVGLVGCDNIPMAAHAAVPLSTIDLPREQLGREAAALILKKISEGSSFESVNKVYPSRLVIRQSTMPTVNRSVGQDQWS